ncbi:hypothetical protein EUTSA_v10017941mg [Eutrema salsugineum]|uniref:Knottin scorpion toxin-like domain-containing protein n=1 Tax=Eutrema salsugineum TaxID=72664 RepID=V4M4Z0_EUTSA|nr:hypothetical protein EUTSA_v10017941mg [Eutrema salsugineum]
MSKAIVFAIFMIVLVLGMLTAETEGEQMCYKNIITGHEYCESMCTSKWNGTGECVNVKNTICICTYYC